MSGAEAFVVQMIGAVRFVENCKINPVAFVGHDRTTLVPLKPIVSFGGTTLISEKRNSVPPLFQESPWLVVPYRILLANTNPPYG
jgi:hypothetical protein